MVQNSWNEFIGHPHQPFDRVVFEKILSSWYNGIKFSKQRWAIEFGTWIMDDSLGVRRNIFLGQFPYSNAAVKTAARAGSLFFDALTIVGVHLYDIGSDAQMKSEAAGNSTFVTMYDEVLVHADLTDYSQPQKDQEYYQAAVSRHWNDKGNSMETLLFKLYETCQFHLLYYSLYIFINATYGNNCSCIYCKKV